MISEQCKGKECIVQISAKAFKRILNIYLQNLASTQPRTSLPKFPPGRLPFHPGAVRTVRHELLSEFSLSPNGISSPRIPLLSAFIFMITKIAHFEMRCASKPKTCKIHLARCSEVCAGPSAQKISVFCLPGREDAHQALPRPLRPANNRLRPIGYRRHATLED